MTLSNTGNATLSVTSVVASGDFSQTNNCGSVSAGGSCTIRVTFKPKAKGTVTEPITITDNASDSPQTVTLTGYWKVNCRNHAIHSLQEVTPTPLAH